VIKLISVKTRRPDLSRAEFRRHYEGRHVPLGLGFRERFGWARYARSYVVAVRAGAVGFDCLTEFWYASDAALARTRAFAGSPEFRVLDEDDRRFLDVGRRLAFEVEERAIAGAPGRAAPAVLRRVALVLGRRAGVAAPAFSRAALEFARELAAEPAGAWERVALDLRAFAAASADAADGALELAAIAWLWPRAGAEVPAAFAWPDAAAACAALELETVETPPEALAP